MAALNFPSNPSSGDTYVGDNGITYTYDGVKWTATSGGGSGGNANTGDFVFDGTTLTTTNGYPTLVNAPGSDGGVEIDYDSDTVSHAMWLNGDSGLAIAINTNLDEGQSRWFFGTDGKLTFPDGSKQTTAYTGQTSGAGEIYIMANIDGNIVTSTDGVTWGDPVPSGMQGIYRVEAHNGVIVYVPGGEGPDVPGLYYSTEIGTVTLCVGTDSFNSNSVYFSQVRYFAETNKWVAVGYIQGVVNFPVVAHSDNGISWTLVPVDSTFAAEINPNNFNWFLNDIIFLNETNQYVISSSIDDSSTFGGIFITQDVTVPLDGSTHIAINFNVGKVAPWSVIGFGGPPGYMILFNEAFGPESTTVWWGWGTNTSDYDQDSGFWTGSVLSQIGYLPQIAEVAYDSNDFISTTTEGQVITPAFGMGGPYWQVSIPLPYTTTSFSISNTNPAVLTYSGLQSDLTDNEKIIITDANSYNGEYFWKQSDGTLYTDQGLSTALDASGFETFTSGTLTSSHGTYFDAAGTSLAYYFVGNDDEQIFRSSNGVTWTLMADVDGQYFNDFAYGTFGAGSTISDRLTSGDYSVVLQSDGNISIPSNSVVSTTDSTGLRLRASGSQGFGRLEYVSDIEGPYDYNAKVQVDSTGVKIHTSGDTCQWTFDYNGNLTLPAAGGDIKTSDGNSILDRISAGGKSASLDSSSHDLMLPNGVVYRYDETVLGGVGTGPEGYTLYSMDGKTFNIMAQANGQPVNWQFNGIGEIIFPDGTVQTTAYDYAPAKLVNLDGGIASTQFDISYAYVDCGGSARRGVLNVDTFDGEDNGAGQTQFDKVLNGGGA